MAGQRQVMIIHGLVVRALGHWLVKNAVRVMQSLSSTSLCFKRVDM